MSSRQQGKHTDKVRTPDLVAADLIIFILFCILVAKCIYTNEGIRIAITNGAFCMDVLFPPVVSAVILLTYFMIKNNSCLETTCSSDSWACIALAVLGSIAFVYIATWYELTALRLSVTVVSTAVSVVSLATIGQMPKFYQLTPVVNICEHLDPFLICTLYLTVVPPFGNHGLNPFFLEIAVLFITYFTFFLHVGIAVCILKAEGLYMYLVKYKCSRNLNVRKLFHDHNELWLLSLLNYISVNVALFAPKLITTSYIINATVGPVVVVASLSMICPSSLDLLLKNESGKVIQDLPEIESSFCMEQSTSSLKQNNEDYSAVRQRGEMGQDSLSEEHFMKFKQRAQEHPVGSSDLVIIQGDGNNVVSVPPGYQGNVTVHIHYHNTTALQNE